MEKFTDNQDNSSIAEKSQQNLSQLKIEKITWINIIILVFVLITLINWFVPTFKGCENNCNVFYDFAENVDFVMGVIAGLAVMVKIIVLSRGFKHLIIKCLIILSGIGLGGIVFIIGILNAMNDVVKANGRSI